MASVLAAAARMSASLPFSALPFSESTMEMSRPLASAVLMASGSSESELPIL